MLSKLFSLVMAIYYLICPLVSPSTDDVITALDEDAVKLTFAAMADPQISNYMLTREPAFRAAGDDLANAKTPIDALVIAGDVTENALECEYDAVTEDIIDTNVKNFIIATGNHDIRLRCYSQASNRFINFHNNLNKSVNSDLTIDELHYSYDINGYTFIVLGSDRTEFEEVYLNKQQLIWFDKTLEAKTKDGKPVFVVVHQSFKNTHGLPDTWNSPIDAAGTMGEQNDEVRAIFNKYDNVIMLSGHLHTGFGKYTYERIDNFDSINLPSVGIENKDGGFVGEAPEEAYNDAGVGYMVEVYDDEVIFRARDFAKGKYLPKYDITIEID